MSATSSVAGLPPDHGGAPRHATVRSVDPRAAVVDALTLLLGSEAALHDVFAVPRIAVAELRRGTRAPTIAQSLALVHLLREHAARLQLAAESILDATRSDVARVASDAYDRAMRAPDTERAVETALQALFDMCG